MGNKRFFKKMLCLALVLVFGLAFIGCDEGSSNLVDVRVINETGRTITDVKFTGSDGTVITVEEFERRGMGHRGQGHCWMNQDDRYTLSWECPIDGPMYAQEGGLCGGRERAHRFRFRDDQESAIVLRADNTWAFVSN